MVQRVDANLLMEEPADAGGRHDCRRGPLAQVVHDSIAPRRYVYIVDGLDEAGSLSMCLATGQQTLTDGPRTVRLA